MDQHELHCAKVIKVHTYIHMTNTKQQFINCINLFLLYTCSVNNQHILTAPVNCKNTTDLTDVL